MRFACPKRHSRQGTPGATNGAKPMCDTALEIIARHAEAGAALRSAFFAAQGARVAEAARHMAVSLARGGKILLAGNGGSAADAQHWAGEFVNRFILDRPPLPAIALSTDSSVLTAIGNDFGYDRVFAKQIEALARPGDVFVAISTSGNSANLIEALHAARRQEAFCIGVTGEGGGRMAGLCDLLLAVPTSLVTKASGISDAPDGTGPAAPAEPANPERQTPSPDDAAGGERTGNAPPRGFMLTPLIQEVHEAIGHLLCGLVDHYLFENVMAIKPFLKESESRGVSRRV